MRPVRFLNPFGWGPGLGGGPAFGRGDLYVHVLTETPTGLTPEQDELLRQFAASRGEDVAPPGTGGGHGEGVFSRLRSAFG
ncbi:MAG TPA: hypothetical protein VMF35_05525 [Acidimicrobiales bacterium]|nr:hypothetical protein [Acidimicrobiales bacterium]